MRSIILKRLTVLCLSVFILFAFCIPASADEKDTLKGKTVNLNTATAEELAQVPMITEEMAEAIVEYREESGEFQVIEELLQIDGFDRTVLKRIKVFLLLEGIGGDECTC